MAGGEIRINITPGFGSLMQDLTRHPLDPANARPGPATLPNGPGAPAQPDAGPGVNRFVPPALPLPSASLQRPAEADRRSRSLADIREAFLAFDEPAEDAAKDLSAAARTGRPPPENTRPETERPRDPASMPDLQAVPARQPGEAARRPDDLRLRLRSTPSPSGHAALDSLQASTAARAAPRRPASSQPLLMIIGSAVLSAALAWILLRMI